MDYQEVETLLNREVFGNSKSDLLIKLATYPERYIGLFRPSKPQGKILQNLLQSHEIRFGDTMEKIFEKYFQLAEFEILTNDFNGNVEDHSLRLDFYMKRNGSTYFIEQKIRDDHDSTKKRGQVRNFNEKLDLIIEKRGDTNLIAILFFVDPSFKKNKNFYDDHVTKVKADYEIQAYTCYGSELFDLLSINDKWDELLDHLRQWKSNILDIPEINFESDINDTLVQFSNLKPKDYLGLFSTPELKEFLHVLFPNGSIFPILIKQLQQKDLRVYANIIQKIKTFLSTYN